MTRRLSAKSGPVLLTGFEPFGHERRYMIVDGAPQDEIHMVHFAPAAAG